MDETYHYDAILEAYTKQDESLKGKAEQLNKYGSEYQDALKRLEKIRKDVEDSLKLNQEKQKLIKNTHCVSAVCAESGLTWDQVKQKQSKLCESRTKIRSVSEIDTNKLQYVSKDLKHLEIQHQLKNISTKIEDYQNKTKIVSETVNKKCDQYQNLNFVVITTDYQIAPNIQEQHKSKDFTMSFTQVNEGIKKVLKNKQNIDAKTKELEEQL